MKIVTEALINLYRLKAQLLGITFYSHTKDSLGMHYLGPGTVIAFSIYTAHGCSCDKSSGLREHTSIAKNVPLERHEEVWELFLHELNTVRSNDEQKTHT